jgi:hypothetical protein
MNTFYDRHNSLRSTSGTRSEAQHEKMLPRK